MVKEVLRVWSPPVLRPVSGGLWAGVALASIRLTPLERRSRMA